MTMARADTNDPMLPQPYLVRQVVKETADTFTLTLEPSSGTGGNRFQPGQFSMLWVFGVGELQISISGDPAERDRLVYTVRSVGQATQMLVSCEVGETVGVRGPFGTGWPVHRGQAVFPRCATLAGSRVRGGIRDGGPLDAGFQLIDPSFKSVPLC
jgi:NAD(P)H-flavin reductase